MKKIKVPKLKQKGNDTCGPTALSMVLRHYGEKISEKEIKDKINGTKKPCNSKTKKLPKYTKTINLAEYSRKKDYNVICYSYNKKLAKNKAEIKIPSIKTIINFLKKKIPVVLAVNASILFDEKKFSDEGHFIVLTRYKKEIFSYNDPMTGKENEIDEDKLIFALSNNVTNSSAYLLAITPKIKTFKHLCK